MLMNGLNDFEKIWNIYNLEFTGILEELSFKRKLNNSASSLAGYVVRPDDV